MKKFSIIVSSVILICMIQDVSGQIEDTAKKIQMEMAVLLENL